MSRLSRLAPIFMLAVLVSSLALPVMAQDNSTRASGKRIALALPRPKVDKPVVIAPVPVPAQDDVRQPAGVTMPEWPALPSGVRRSIKNATRAIEQTEEVVSRKVVELVIWVSKVFDSNATPVATPASSPNLAGKHSGRILR